MTQGHRHGLRWLSKPQASDCFLIVTEAMDINIDPSCCKATDLGMALGSNSGPDIILALGGSAGHSAQHGSNGSSMALRHQHGSRWWPRPRTWAFMWFLMGTWAAGINTDLGWDRTTNPDVTLGSIPGLDIIMTPGVKQATHVSLLTTILGSSVQPLSAAHGLVPASPFPSLSPPSPFLHYTLITMVSTHMVRKALGRPVVVFSYMGL